MTAQSHKKQSRTSVSPNRNMLAFFVSVVLIASIGAWLGTKVSFAGLSAWVGVQFFLFAVVAMLAFYSVRHYFFTFQRLYGEQIHLHSSIYHAPWPRVVVFVAAHNEETVIADALRALVQVDYPIDRIKIVPVNDRSTDNTRAVIEEVSAQYRGRIHPFHRTGGKPGKAAALKDATALVESEGWAQVILVFDADYLPSRGLIKQLVAPFQDIEVGAVMGRVVPQNAGSNLLTRLLDLERSGGYQVDQQARSNLGSVPQYGGTVGGLRLSALADSGGWHDDVLAEDTDITFRLLLKGWKTIYLNEAECYEEVPEQWPVRSRQIGRWAKGHNQALYRHIRALCLHTQLTRMEKFDGFALLAIYAMPIILMMGWVSALALFYSEYGLALNGAMALMLMLTYSSFGNFAAFFQIAAAGTLDGRRDSLRLLPLVIMGFLVSVVSISKATFDLVIADRLFKRQLRWDKTVRYRTAPVISANADTMAFTVAA